MSFYVSRLLGSGPIRFGVTERVADPAIDDLGGESLSTGPSGEFVRFRTASPISSSPAGSVEIETAAPTVDGGQRESVVPMWGWVTIVIGGLLLLLGLVNAVMKNVGVGVVLILIGAALVALPFLATAKEKKEQRAKLDRQRRERQEQEKRIQEIAGAYVDKVRSLSSATDEKTLAAVRAAREGKDIPYEHMRQPARDAALRVAFDALAKWDDSQPGGGVRDAIDRAAIAMGLSDEDRRAVRLATFQKAWWHQLADDRMSPELRGRLETLRESLRITPEDVEVETDAAAEFEKLRGITPRTLPKPECPLRLRPLEVCVHVTKARMTETGGGRFHLPGQRTMSEEPWTDGPEEELVITTQRVMMGQGKTLEIDIRKIWDLEAHIELEILAITLGGGKRKSRHHLRLSEPIVTGTLILLAAAAPLKPKGLV